MAVAHTAFGQSGPQRYAGRTSPWGGRHPMYRGTADSAVLQGSPRPSPAPPLVPTAADLGVYALFRALPGASTRQVMSQMERQDRIVFMLLDGKRTIRVVAQLVHRSELEVARAVARLLKSGHIEYIREAPTLGSG